MTDLKGLNIAMTSTTSDYLQADEGWWKSAFNNGSGAVFIDTVEYDESSKTYAMNIGVPIYDPKTQKAIGILRGTLDISVMMNTLGNITLGKTGSVTLIGSQGIVLFAKDPARRMKPAPETALALFKNWRQRLGARALILMAVRPSWHTACWVENLENRSVGGCWWIWSRLKPTRA